MIFDSHAYCFTAPDTAAGHASSREHLAYWQRQYALHHQPAFRVRDGAPGDSRLLLQPTADEPLRLASDRNFRVDRVSGRLVWTIDGEDFTKQQLPPNVIEYSAGALIAEMDYAKVDRALLHADATLSKDSVFLAACVKAYPHRLRAMAPMEETLIPNEPDAAIEKAHQAIETFGLHALKIIPEYAYRATTSKSFLDSSWEPFWRAATQLKVPFFFTLGARPGSNNPRDGFVEEIFELRKWMDRYPSTRVCITHGYPWRDYLDGDRFCLPDAMWKPFADSNLCLEVGFPYRIGDLFDFPYVECRPVIEAMMRHIGPDRLFWGTDMPFQNRFCTYRQSRDFIEKYCRDLLSDSETAKIMGGSVSRFLEG